jgi:hypothetical protein
VDKNIGILTSARCVLAAACLIGGAFAQVAPKAPPLQAPEARLSRRDNSSQRPQEQLPSRSNLNITTADVPHLVLPPLDVERIRHERDVRSGTLDNSLPQRPHRQAREIGINRDVRVRAMDGRWVTTVSGHTWIIQLTSPAALETRLHFDNFHLPPGTKLFVGTSADDESTRSFDGNGPSGTGEFWSQIIPGDTVRLELLDDSGAVVEASGVLPFTVTSIGHVYDGGFGSSAPCELDFMCYPDYTSEGDSVVRIEFSDPQYIYVCSAVLMNNLSGDFSPLLLTAHHCISTDALARTVQVYWKYQSFSCNGQGPAGDGVSYPTTLLATTLDDTDASLLQVLDMVYTTRTWAAWSTVDPAISDAVVGIHHPHGDPKKISFGNRTADIDPQRYGVFWSSGLMEAGSSGSPLFNANKQVVGQLWGGSSSCTSPGPDVYGRLNLSYGQLTGPNGWNYLQQGLPDDQYAPNQTRNTAATIPFPFNGTGLILKVTADDWFSVPVPSGQTVVVMPVYTSTWGWGGIELYHANDTSPVVRVTDSNQRLTYTNTDPTPSNLYIHLFLLAGVRLPYTLSVAPLSQPTVDNPWPLTVAFGKLTLGANCYSDSQYLAWFEYSTDPAMATWTDTLHQQLIGYVDVLGLPPSTTYYFRYACSNSAGTTRSSIKPIATSAFPVPSIWYPAAGSVGIPATIAIHGGGTSFDLYFGTNPDPPLASPDASVSTAYSSYEFQYQAGYVGFLMPAGSLVAGQHYYWKMVAHYQGLSAASSVSDFYADLASAQPNPIVFPPILVGTTRTISTTVYGNLYNSVYPPLTFGVAGDGFSALPNPGGCWYSCVVTVIFHPTASGTYTASLAISSSAISGTTYIPITGSAFDLVLTRPMRPARSGTVSAGQSRTIPFTLSTSSVAGNVALTCEVIPALADCVLDRESTGGLGNWQVQISLRTRRPMHATVRRKYEADPALRRGTPPGVYTVRVTASFEGATRSLDFPVAVR